MKSEISFENALQAYRDERWEEALDLFASAILADPIHVASWIYRALALNRLGRTFDAFVHMTRALEIDPKRPDAWCNRGIFAANLSMHEEAENSLLKALEFGEAFEPHQNLGDLYIRMMRLEEAEREFLAAVKLAPNHAVAHGNLARVLIALGKWNEGHRENQWRHRITYPPRARRLYPIYAGQDLDGRTILLYPEGGYGDQILGMRYAKAFAHRQKRHVVLEANAKLLELAQTLAAPNLLVVLRDGKPPIKPDYCCAISDAPMWLGIMPKTVPYPDGYLRMPLRDGPLIPGNGPRVGLCWLAGKRPLEPWTDRLSAAKSIALEQLAPLMSCGVQFISLQLDRGDRALMRRFNIFDPMARVEDFGDTAAIINQLDLVISIDSAVAHLAGAMGRPVWNLIRFDEIVTYPPGAVMYSSMKMYRQERLGDWAGVIARVADDLDQFVVERAAGSALQAEHGERSSALH